MQFSYSEKGLALTKSFEGLRLEAYQDVAGVWTIGYGHTGPELLSGMKITQADADALLRADVQTAVNFVNKKVTARSRSRSLMRWWTSLSTWASAMRRIQR